MLSRPNDEHLRRCAWTKDIDSVLPLFKSAKKQLAELGVAWQHGTPFPPTTEQLGNFSGHDWRRWIQSVETSDAEGLDALSRFTVTCARRLGEVKVAEDELLQKVVDAPQERSEVPSNDACRGVHSEQRSMFNLLVASDPTAWETEQLMRMDVSRFGEYSGGEAAEISLRDRRSLKILEQVPALLMYEQCCESVAANIVRYGFLKDIRVVGRSLQFRFEGEGYCTREVVRGFNRRLEIDDFEYNRTHWAIKDGGIPRELLARMTREPYRTYRYEVVLSYAGENRDYVHQVAEFLKNHGIDPFYDRHEEASLWGKDLAEELDIVYRTEGRYCVMFISKHYAEKVWPTHERRAALARAVEERKEYILPARFDDTEVPGIRPTLSYIDLSRKTPEDLGRLILQKLGRQPAR